ncbi:hypothetical protein RSOLAG22IIIB_01160 [Rhizoctonia solani]|uniref:Uncharacterized protein n=1 Tax=Rhizoctonia solani TaxID=456999 RepID=A0A0K6G277_9AGAM|nr:hypothetical protein RSOLAG22IIIB_01160 [Rhizoctonia solani]
MSLHLFEPTHQHLDIVQWQVRNVLPPLVLVNKTSPTAAASDTALLDNDSSSIPTVTCQIKRMIAMFWPPRTALNAYPDLQQAIEDGWEATLRAAASPAEKTYNDIYDELERIWPNSFERLVLTSLVCRSFLMLR